MRTVILGATGSTGGLAVDEALSAGHDVVAYVRNPAAMTQRPELTVLGGSVEDEHAMGAAFSAADAVVSCLGVRTSVAAITRPVDFQQRMLPKVIAAINAARIPRFVLLSSFGIGDTRTKASFVPRAIYAAFAARIFEDKARAELALADCQANWTAIYPVTLHKGPIDPEWDLLPLDSVTAVPGVPRLSYHTVARVLIQLADDRSHASQRLLLTTKRGWRA